MEKLTVSMELLKVAAKRRLGLRIEAVVSRWLTKRATHHFYEKADLDELTAIVLEETGMAVKFKMWSISTPGASARTLNLLGHSGTSYKGPDSKPVTMSGTELTAKLMKVVIDLDKGKIDGPLLPDLVNELTLTTGLITDTNLNTTAEEITGVIAHELGHCFNQYLALGDYVWLNYILQDGLEVLQGLKPNVYKLEVLTQAGLNKYCKDPALLKRIQQAPDAANLRRAVLLATVNAPRHHLRSGTVDLSRVREEQMADLYASRLGYARALATLNARLDKRDGAWQLMSSAEFTFVETLKVTTALAASVMTVAGVVFPPAWLMALAFVSVNRAVDFMKSDAYDNPQERLNKLRRDLIAQLKVLGGDPKQRDTLLNDLKVIDAHLSAYRQHTTVWEAVTTLLSPVHRRERHQRAREEQFERLLHNDLFVQASKINTLIRKS